MERLEHILSGRHAKLIEAEWVKERKRRNARALKRILARKKEDPQFRMRCNLRTRVRAALIAKKVKRCDVGLIGCSQAELFAHIEKQFTEGMTWENYGLWYIDHIKPCASFDLLNPEEQRKCFHFTNLQPLWAEDNWSKGSKV